MIALLTGDGHLLAQLVLVIEHLVRWTVHQGGSLALAVQELGAAAAVLIVAIHLHVATLLLQACGARQLTLLPFLPILQLPQLLRQGLARRGSQEPTQGQPQKHSTHAAHALLLS